MDELKLEKQLQNIITSYADKIWYNNEELKYNVDIGIEFEEAIWKWIKENFVPVEAGVKPATCGNIYIVFKRIIGSTGAEIVDASSIKERAISIKEEGLKLKNGNVYWIEESKLSV